MSEDEPTRLERHVNAAEHWLDQADIYDFPNPVRTECLQLAAIHAELAGALARRRRVGVQRQQGILSGEGSNAGMTSAVTPPTIVIPDGL